MDPDTSEPLFTDDSMDVSKPVVVKKELVESTWNVHDETIDLLSDDDDNEITGPGVEPTTEKGDVQTEMAPPPPRGLDLGKSMFKAQNDSNAQTQTPQQVMLAAQRKMAEIFRARQQLPSSKIADDTAEMPDPPAKVRGRRSKDAAAAKFEKHKTTFQKKKRAGTATLQDEIEYMKAEHAEQNRLRKIEADEEYDRTPTPEDAEGMFVSENEDPAQTTAPTYSAMFSEDEEENEQPKKRKRQAPFEEDDDESDQGAGRKRKGTKPAPNKKARKVAGTEYTEDDVQVVLQRAKTAKTNAKTNAKKKGGAPAKGAKAAPKRRAGPNMTNLGSILGTDVFGDTAATKDLPNQPKFQHGGGRRADQLKALIASVPTEANKKVAAADKRFLDEAIKSFTGHATVRPADGGNWSVKGMRSTLKHYQIMGTAFMRRRENDTVEPRGGILADQMGLGKTVMMLANIVNGKPKERAKHRATLIVASPALVTQWRAEIEKHTMDKREHKQYGLGTVLEFTARSRINSNNNMDLLEQADIVLTTYSEVLKSYPKADVPPNLVTAAQKDEWWTEYYEKNCGMLHRVKFFRIVLDEAQAIKNHMSATSMACRALKGIHHWAITGTPILNTVKEFYPYFKFLKEPHTGSYRIFKHNFCSPDDPDGTEKLSVFLRKIMIRRTHLDRLFDARLLDLPTPQEHTLWLEFNEVERQVYEIVKKRFIQRINMISKQSGLEKQYGHIWTMILRLRQICGHILLVQGTVMDLLEREDFEKLNRITSTEDETMEEGASLLVHLRNVLKNNVGVKTIEGGVQGAVISENETITIDVTDLAESVGQTGGKHGLSFHFRKYLEQLMGSDHWDAITQRCLCTGCRQPPNNPHVTSCFHIYCFSCLTDLQHLAARRGHDQARCSECGEAYTAVEPCKDIENFSRRETTASSTPEALVKATKKGRKSKNDELPEDWIGLQGEVLPSAKTSAVKAQIMNWLEEDPEAKIIVYTQFIPMIRILGKICATETWDFVTYTGQMSHDSRAKAIEEFASKPEKKIMLASLKSGGLGLNLTMASRVICLDPWWNSAVEQQAFCRVFRIGQFKETRMTRFVVKNTIDAAMMAMKERKQIEIDEVMNDSRRKDTPTVHDLLRLFGNQVGEDGEGRPFIFAEGGELDDGEHLRLPNNDEEDEGQFMGNEE